jgi:hypothetical protein
METATDCRIQPKGSLPAPAGRGEFGAMIDMPETLVAGSFACLAQGAFRQTKKRALGGGNATPGQTVRL